MTLLQIMQEYKLGELQLGGFYEEGGGDALKMGNGTVVGGGGASQHCLTAVESGKWNLPRIDERASVAVAMGKSQLDSESAVLKYFDSHNLMM